MAFFLRNGLHLLAPTSIASTGAGNSSSISANGSVTFSSCATLSLNGVFSADYDNYLIVSRYTAGNLPFLYYRLRLSGTDASGSNYSSQYIIANGSTASGARGTSETMGYIGLPDDDVAQNGFCFYVYSPYLAQPTASRSHSANSSGSAYLAEHGVFHSLSTSYDGITIYPQSGSIGGRVAVYGLRK